MYAFQKKKREKLRVSPLNPWTLTSAGGGGACNMRVGVVNGSCLFICSSVIVNSNQQSEADPGYLEDSVLPSTLALARAACKLPRNKCAAACHRVGARVVPATLRAELQTNSHDLPFKPSPGSLEPVIDSKVPNSCIRQI